MLNRLLSIIMLSLRGLKTNKFSFVYLKSTFGVYQKILFVILILFKLFAAHFASPSMTESISFELNNSWLFFSGTQCVTLNDFICLSTSSSSLEMTCESSTGGGFRFSFSDPFKKIFSSRNNIKTGSAISIVTWVEKVVKKIFHLNMTDCFWHHHSIHISR